MPPEVDATNRTKVSFGPHGVLEQNLFRTQFWVRLKIHKSTLNRCYYIICREKENTAEISTEKRPQTISYEDSL